MFCLTLETEKIITAYSHVITLSTTAASLLDSWISNSTISKHQHVVSNKSNEISAAVQISAHSRCYKNSFGGKYKFDKKLNFLDKLTIFSCASLSCRIHELEFLRRNEKFVNISSNHQQY